MPEPALPKTPWSPVQLGGDPAALARSEMPAIAAFWRRVKDDFAEVDPASVERLARSTRHAGGMGEEVAAVLARPLSIPMLQDLHVLATRDQTAARVVLTDGSYRYVPFPYGKLKDKPNHLIVAGRVVAEFCPPQDVVGELERMLRVHDEIPAARTDVRAAWLLYAFLRIHPFADGNGRVARLLASWDFLDAGLPPVWGEGGDLGAGWADTLDAATRSGDLAPVTALLAGHQLRQVTRLLAQVEAAPSAAAVDEVLAHGEALARLSARWADHARVVPAQVPALSEVARDRLAQLGPRLRGDPVVETAIGAVGPGGRPRGWAAARDAGIVTDPRVPGARVCLRAAAPRASLCVALAALGTSGSGAWTAFVSVRPRDASGRAIPALTLLPDEGSAARAARFSSWLDDALAEAVGIWHQIV